MNFFTYYIDTQTTIVVNMTKACFDNILPSGIISDLRKLIFSHLGGEQAFWKELFTNKVIPQLDPKGYFSRNVLPYINKGWREVGLITSPCFECRHTNGFVIPNPECSECWRLEPCGNCYWHNSDPYNLGNTCGCSTEKTLITWEDMMVNSDFLEKYPRYDDFIRGKDWTDYLQEQADLAIEIERRFEQALARQEEMFRSMH